MTQACRYEDPRLSPPGPPLAFVSKLNLKVGLFREGWNSFPMETCHSGAPGGEGGREELLLSQYLPQD